MVCNAKQNTAIEKQGNHTLQVDSQVQIEERWERERERERERGGGGGG